MPDNCGLPATDTAQGAEPGPSREAPLWRRRPAHTRRPQTPPAMLSDRHAFHAGNPTGVLEHFVIVERGLHLTRRGQAEK